MGVRVQFYLGAADGLEGVFWGAGPHQFRDWAYGVEDEYPETYSLELLFRLDRIAAEGPGSLVPDDRRDAEVVDAIFDAFVGDYSCMAARLLLKSASDAMPGELWYREAQERVDRWCSASTSRCWAGLLGGRAVGRPSLPYPYAPRDSVFRVGYWTAEEVRSIGDDLRSVFRGSFRRGEGWARGESLGPPRTKADWEWAIEVAAEALSQALRARTGLVTTVA